MNFGPVREFCDRARARGETQVWISCACCGQHRIAAPITRGWTAEEKAAVHELAAHAAVCEHLYREPKPVASKEAN